MNWTRYQFGPLRDMAEDFDDIPAPGGGGDRGGSDGGETEEVGGGGDKPKEPKGDKGKGNDEVARLRRELEESREDARFWSEKAKAAPPATPRGGKADPAGDADDDGDDDDAEVDIDPDKFIDEFGKDPKRALAKLGLVTKKEARQLADKVSRKNAAEIAESTVGRATGRLSQDAQLAQDYPELTKPGEFQTGVAERVMNIVGKQRYAEAVKDPVILRLAAEAQRESMRGRNDDREDRIRRQAGGTGRGYGDSLEDDEDLDMDQQEGLRSMRGNVNMPKEVLARIERRMKQSKKGGRN